MTHTQDVINTTAHLSARWKGANKTLLRAAFPLLATGHSVQVTQLAQAINTSPAVVQEALNLMRSEVNDKGQLVELFGYMVHPTLHRVEINGTALFSCCALFSHVIPLLVAQTAHIESVDPVNRRIVRLVIDKEGLVSYEPREAVANLVVTDPEELKRSIVPHFCSQVFHFSSRETAAKFVDQGQHRYILPMEEFHQAAQLLYKEVWS